MARAKKPTAQQLAIIEKAQELNVLLGKLPSNTNNSLATNNINQSIRYLVTNN